MTISGTKPVSLEYRLTLSALAEAARRRDDELATAELAYQESAAAASGELARAEGEAAEADRWAGAAASAVFDVDREAGQLWDDLRRSAGWRARRLGEVPEPAQVGTPGRTAIPHTPQEVPAQRSGPAREMLDRAAERIDRSQRRVARRPLPGRLLPLLPLVGAVLAAAVGLLAGGLVTLGQGPTAAETVLRLAGWAAFLVAPSAGLPVAAYAAHRHHQARLDVTGIALTLLGGTVAATALSVSYFTG